LRFPQQDVFAFFSCPFGPTLPGKVPDHLQSTKRLVFVYQGSGAETLAERAWLTPFASFGDGNFLAVNRARGLGNLVDIYLPFTLRYTPY
jgi:hypothetical protein